jgi:hypothetical protein
MLNILYSESDGAQHGGLPAWLEEKDLAGVILYLMDGCTSCLFRTVPVALTEGAQLRTGGISNCCYIINIPTHFTTIRHELRQARKAWSDTLVDPCLLSG